MGDDSALLVYDSDCRFCTRSATWAAPRLQTGRVVASNDAPPATSYGLEPGAFTRSVYWIEPDGRMFAGHRAVSRAMRDIGGAYGVGGTILAMPPVRWLSALVYRVVARNRHHLPGGTASCRVGS